jgi:hypothetical protein
MAVKNFMVYIKTNFGVDAHKLVKYYNNNNCKLAKTISSKKFLIKCRKKGKIPRHIKQSFKCTHALFDKSSKIMRKAEEAIKRFQHRILNLEIEATYETISNLKGLMEKGENLLREKLPAHIVDEYIEQQCLFYEKFLPKRNITNKRRITRMTNEMLVKNENFVVNLTSHEIPIPVHNYFSYGPKMMANSQMGEKKLINIIADTEHIIKQLPIPDEEKKHTQQKVCNAIQNHINRDKKIWDVNDREILAEYKETLRFIDNINKNPDEKQHIYVLNSDKGNTTCVLHKQAYEDQMKEILNEKTNFRSCRQDPTNKIQKELTDLLEKMVKKSNISADTKKELLEKHPEPPKIYGLPKVHKIDPSKFDPKNPNECKVPLRPITAFMNSPLYKTSKYIADTLNISKADAIFKYTSEIRMSVLIRTHQSGCCEHVHDHPAKLHREID